MLLHEKRDLVLEPRGRPGLVVVVLEEKLVDLLRRSLARESSVESEWIEEWDMGIAFDFGREVP